MNAIPLRIISTVNILAAVAQGAMVVTVSKYNGPIATGYFALISACYVPLGMLFSASNRVDILTSVNIDTALIQAVVQRGISIFLALAVTIIITVENNLAQLDLLWLVGSIAVLKTIEAVAEIGCFYFQTKKRSKDFIIYGCGKVICIIIVCIVSWWLGEGIDWRLLFVLSAGTLLALSFNPIVKYIKKKDLFIIFKAAQCNVFGFKKAILKGVANAIDSIWTLLPRFLFVGSAGMNTVAAYTLLLQFINILGIGLSSKMQAEMAETKRNGFNVMTSVFSSSKFMAAYCLSAALFSLFVPKDIYLFILGEWFADYVRHVPFACITAFFWYMSGYMTNMQLAVGGSNIIVKLNMAVAIVAIATMASLNFLQLLNIESSLLTCVIIFTIKIIISYRVMGNK